MLVSGGCRHGAQSSPQGTKKILFHRKASWAIASRPSHTWRSGSAIVSFAAVVWARHTMCSLSQGRVAGQPQMHLQRRLDLPQPMANNVIMTGQWRNTGIIGDICETSFPGSLLFTSQGARGQGSLSLTPSETLGMKMNLWCWGCEWS